MEENEIERIELTAAQQQRLQRFKEMIEPLQKQIAAYELGVNSMLNTVTECRGAKQGVRYSLTPDEKSLVMIREETDDVAQQ